ncbi:MAG: SprT-like family protein [Gemmataceae bacterium]
MASGDLPRTALLPALALPADERTQRLAAIRSEALARLGTADFTHLSPMELEAWFDAYDAAFFGGAVRRALQQCNAPLGFAFSSRLTRSAGLTKQFRPRRVKPRPRLPGARYEIVLSRTLLLHSFNGVERVVRVNGLPCHDRLEAALRIFEHELIHLLEMLEYGVSSCDQLPFRDAARTLFDHQATKHELVMPHEHASATRGLAIGDRVQFDTPQGPVVGLLNRITQRATVLVEHPRGVRYRDGRTYVKYYVPLALLKRV